MHLFPAKSLKKLCCGIGVTRGERGEEGGETIGPWPPQLKSEKNFETDKRLKMLLLIIGRG
jgi:hypothetical protein